VPSASSPDFEYQLQKLVGRNVTPTSGLSEQDWVRFTAAKRTLDQNYYEVDKYIDGDLATNPIFICHQDEPREEGFEALRLLHNYLSSVYSFNETVRVLFNRHTEANTVLQSSDFTPASGGSDRSYYARKLSFLRGIRTDFQHGGFSCLSFEKVGELGDFGGYHIVFDREAFLNESGLDDPSRFLQQTNENEQQHPLCYIGTFHQQTLQEFYEDSGEWFELY
jgi:hypothetical protein